MNPNKQKNLKKLTSKISLYLSVGAFVLSSCGKNSKDTHDAASLQNKVEEKTKNFNASYDDKTAKVYADLPEISVSAQEIRQQWSKVQSEADARLSQVAVRDPAEVTFENTAKELDEITYIVSSQESLASYIAAVANDKSLIDASLKVEEDVKIWRVELEQRKDVFERLKVLAPKIANNSPEDQELYKSLVSPYETQGLNLPEDTQAHVKTLKIQLINLTTEFKRNLAIANKATTRISTEEMGALDPIGERELSPLKQEDGSYEVRLAVPAETSPVLQYSRNEALREKLYWAIANRTNELNLPVSEKIVQTRIKIAQLLGQPSWAEYVIKSSNKSVIDAAGARKFVEALALKFKAKFEQEKKELVALKQEETGKSDAQLEPWDIAYYSRVYKNEVVDFDPNELKPYFEYEHVFEKMLERYSTLFKLKIEKVDAPYVWNDKVQLLSFRDSESNKFLGFLYLDLFSNSDQVESDEITTYFIRNGIVLNDGKEIRPVSALKANLRDAEEEGTILLSLDEVENLFQEFSRATYGILSEVSHAQLSGNSIARNLVEAPSQFLGYLVRDPATLKTLGKHFQTGEEIPELYLKKVQQLRTLDSGLTYEKKFALALSDLKIHMDIKSETVSAQQIDQLYKKTLAEIYLPSSREVSGIADLSTVFARQDNADFISDIWADVIAADVAAKFKGFADEEMGAKYRSEVIVRGASRPLSVSTEKFLGKPVAYTAFFRMMGVEEAEKSAPAQDPQVAPQEKPQKPEQAPKK